MLTGLEPLMWGLLWVFLRRVVARMVRNAKVDLVTELAALALEALRFWNVPKEDAEKIITAAYDPDPARRKSLLDELTNQAKLTASAGEGLSPASARAPLPPSPIPSPSPVPSPKPVEPPVDPTGTGGPKPPGGS